MPQVTVKIIHRLEDLAEYHEQWDQLAFAPHSCRPTLSYGWVVSFLEHCLNPDEEWVCLVATDDGSLAGVLPLIITYYQRWGIRRPRLHTPRDSETDSIDFLTVPNRHREIAASLLSEVELAAPKWFELSMHRLPEFSPTMKLVDKSLSGIRLIDDLNGWGSFIKTEGDFGDYQQSLSTNFRKNLKKAHRKLAKLPDVETRFVRADDITNQDYEKFINLEAAGWKGREGTAINNSARHLSFYRSLADRLTQGGRLEWHFLSTENKTIAGHLAIRAGRRLVIPKIAYDESYAHCAPGNMLFLSVLEDAFSSQEIDEVDCLTDTAWHANWRMQRRAYYDLRLFPRRPLPTLLGVWPLTVKEKLRHVPLLRPLLRGIRRGLKGRSHE